MNQKTRFKGKLAAAVRYFREALRHLTPVEAVEILVLILWPIFLLIAVKACGLSFPG